MSLKKKLSPYDSTAGEIPPIPEYIDTELSEEEREKYEEELEYERRTWMRSVLEFVGILGVALIISVVVKTFFVQAFYVPSGSMESTLVVDNRILVNRLANEPEDIRRGDIVVFSDPNNWLGSHDDDQPWWTDIGSKSLQAVGLLPASSGDHLVKRVIGIGGDTVECCTVDGYITVNDTPIIETYLDEGVAPSNEDFKVTVPEGQLWVMGDNRDHSKDSRYHNAAESNGFVPVTNVVGRAWAVFYPFSDMHMLEDENDVFDNVPDPS
ncbi:MAG: signal peptidase I [Actinomycetaceae bacterium]|nr:signal peptidase I [Actinomycetaceae bacterium]